MGNYVSGEQILNFEKKLLTLKEKLEVYEKQNEEYKKQIEVLETDLKYAQEKFEQVSELMDLDVPEKKQRVWKLDNSDDESELH